MQIELLLFFFFEKNIQDSYVYLSCDMARSYLIDDSPSCKIIVYRCEVVQLGVCILLSSVTYREQRRKPLLPFFQMIQFFSSCPSLLSYSSILFWRYIVLRHDLLCMWVYSYVLNCVSCSVVSYIICIILWRIIMKRKKYIRFILL